MSQQPPAPLSRREFDALDPAGRRAHLAAGGTIFNGPPPPAVKITISRQAYDAMPVAGQREFSRRGGVIAGFSEQGPEPDEIRED